MYSLNLKGNLSFPVIFDDIHRLMIANKKNIKNAAANKLILENRLIKKISLKPSASNHKKLVYILAKLVIENISRIITVKPNLSIQFFLIISGYLR
tara:strand:- start:2628 stop:2915 length:288 start_codon:yes stop_codon:yes gene_type:complete